jgi:hypothetical protein
MKTDCAYYAHSMRKYNETIEAEEYAFIKDHHKKFVICPNLHLGELGGIEPYLNIIKTVSVVYASEYLDLIGRGVYEECSVALENYIPVLVLRKNEINAFFVVPLLKIEKVEKPTWVLYARLVTE